MRGSGGGWGAWQLESKSGEHGVWWYEQLRPAFSLYHGAPDLPMVLARAGVPPAVWCDALTAHLTGVKLAYGLSTDPQHVAPAFIDMRQKRNQHGRKRAAGAKGVASAALRLTPFGKRSHRARTPEPVAEPASPASKSAK